MWMHANGSREWPRRPRARSHCRFVLPFIRFVPDSLIHSIPLWSKRQCDRTLRRPRGESTAGRAVGPAVRAGGGVGISAFSFSSAAARFDQPKS